MRFSGQSPPIFSVAPFSSSKNDPQQNLGALASFGDETGSDDLSAIQTPQRIGPLQHTERHSGPQELEQQVLQDRDRFAQYALL
jgi:hypothetical protein